MVAYGSKSSLMVLRMEAMLAVLKNGFCVLQPEPVISMTKDHPYFKGKHQPFILKLGLAK